MDNANPPVAPAQGLAAQVLRRPRSGHPLHLVLAGVISVLLLYVAAAILPGAPLGALLTVIGLVAALALWRLPRRALLIADAAVLALIALLLATAGLELIAFCLAGIVGTLALRRHPRGWLHVVTGAVVLVSGQAGVTAALNGALVPELFTEAVPWLDLHLPVLVLGLLMMAGGAWLLAIGAWKLALRLDVLAIALVVAAAAHVTAGVLGFVSLTLPMMLAEMLPGIYEFDEDSLQMTSSMIATLQLGTRSLVMGALIPLALVIMAIARLLRQPRITPHGAPLQPTSVVVAVLTGIALAVPGALILVLALSDADSPLQIALPFVIDIVGFILWIVAVIAWWRHSELVRIDHAPGGDMTSTDLVVTLVLAAVPGLLAVFDIALAFVP